MHPTSRLLQHACRITFFTRQNCSLCTNAKQKLSNVWDKRHFEYKEIDVMTPEGRSWRELYEFDTPVIHISKSNKGEEKPELSGQVQKLMHRFTEEQIVEKMDAAESESN